MGFAFRSIFERCKDSYFLRIWASISTGRLSGLESFHHGFLNSFPLEVLKAVEDGNMNASENAGICGVVISFFWVLVIGFGFRSSECETGGI